MNLFGQPESDTTQLLNAVIQRKSDTSTVGYLERFHPNGYNHFDWFLRHKKVRDIEKKEYVLRLTRKEIKLINSRISIVKQKSWQHNLLSFGELVTWDRFDQYVKSHPTRETYLFSIPIFLRKNSIALISISKYKPGSVNYTLSETAFYKKTAFGWERLALLYTSN